MITLPRRLLVVLGALFTAYQAVLGLVSLRDFANPAPSVAAVLLFIAAVVPSLLGTKRRMMPLWLAAFDLAVGVVMPILVSSQLDPNAITGYDAWYAGAVGALMTIVALRRRQLFAWAGVTVLVVHTLVWAGPPALIEAGVFGSAMWVAGAVLVNRALARTSRDIRRLAEAGREAVEWRAAQEAHVSERQGRLRDTYQVAAPLLSQIAASGGQLSEAQRAECRLLESGIRDEIRGRELLNDAVRREVRAARARGATVTLLDEGGLEGVEAGTRSVILDRLAQALHSSAAHSYVIRTVPRSAEVAVTVVGLTPDPAGGDDEVELWLEIPRAVH